MSEKPKEIWCGTGLYYTYKEDWSEGEWSDNEYEGGVKYVRADLIEELEAKLAKAMQVINMIFAGIPSESNDPEVQTISTILQCKPQTVRNRRDRAVAKLQQILGTEVKDVN